MGNISNKMVNRKRNANGSKMYEKIFTLVIIEFKVKLQNGTIFYLSYWQNFKSLILPFVGKE